MEYFNRIKDEVFSLTGCKKAEKIDKGFSFEEKHLLTGDGDEKYILRIISLSDAKIRGNVAAKKLKQSEFKIIKKISRYSSLVPMAHFFGVTEDESLCYMILDYISGTDGEEALKCLDEDEQYNLGVSAGKELLKLHKLNAPSGLPEWHERQSLKYARKCAIFNELNIDAEKIGMDKISGFISANTPFMRCERQSFLHDDYHPANLIVKNGRLSGIIDFNRYDWGDPVHDFVKTAYFSSAVSVPFSAGQIDGYNGGEVPPEFWKKYSLYSAMTIIPDIVWSYRYSKETDSPAEVERMWERVKRVYLDHNGFESEIPRWYEEYKE